MIVFYAFLVGAIGALFGALLGVGGGIIMVPAFVKMGLPMKTAIGTSLAVILVTALVSTLRNGFGAQIDWKVAGAAALAAVVAAYFGTGLKNQPYVSDAHLKVGFGLFLIAIGIYMVATRASA